MMKAVQTMSAWHRMTLTQCRALLAEGAFTAQELVAQLIGIIREEDPQLQAYLSLDEAQALQEAASADSLRRQGSTAAALLGLPLAIKDNIHVAGQPCSCASRMLTGYQALYDASCIARLRAAGALLVGRTNLDEFAMGSSTEHSAMQITRNPWDHRRVAGGSSGGSAAAVAADLALAALGSDTGGSVRLPAAYCGCVGLRPSYGRISRYGLAACASSLDQIGPITKDVRDAALLLQLMAGHDPRDATSALQPVPDFEAALSANNLAGLKLGLPREYFEADMDPEVARLVQEARGQCERLGAKLVEVSLPMTRYAGAVYHIIACAEASTNLARCDGVRYGLRVAEVADIDAMYCRSRGAGFGEEVKRRLLLGTYALSADGYAAYFRRAQQIRTLIRQDFEQAFQDCDVLLTPTTPQVAEPIGGQQDKLPVGLMNVFLVPASLAGICALSVPCGFTAANLPVGLQFIGPAFGEERILGAAYAYEQASAWRQRKPPAPQSSQP